MKFRKGDKVIVYDSKNKSWSVEVFFDYIFERCGTSRSAMMSTHDNIVVSLENCIPYSDAAWEKYKYLNKSRQDLIDAINDFYELSERNGTVVYENELDILENENIKTEGDSHTVEESDLTEVVKLLKSINKKLDNLNYLNKYYISYPATPGIKADDPFKPPYTITCSSDPYRTDISEQNVK